MTKKYLLAGFLIFSVLLSACGRTYQAADVAVTPSVTAQFPVANPAQTMAALQTQGASQSTGQPGDVTSVELTEGAASNGTAITPVTQVTFTSTPIIGGSGVTVTVTTPAVGVTPQAVATTAVAPTAVVGRPTTYVLQPGEFPYCIARRYNVDPDELLALSGLSAGIIYPSGTLLRIPQSGDFPGDRALRAHPATYTVTGNGDTTVYAVACLFGDVTPEAIAQRNSISVSATLTIGQQLAIP